MPRQSDAGRRHTYYFLMVLRQADELYELGGLAVQQGLQLFDQNWLNIRLGQFWSAVNSATDRAASELCSYYPDAGPYCLNLRQHPNDALQWRNSALESSRALGKLTLSGFHLGGIGLAYMAMGQAQRAIESYMQALKVLQAQAHEQGQTLVVGNLIHAYLALGQIEPARKFAQQQMTRTQDQTDQRALANAWNNLGLICHAEANFVEALSCFDRALSLARAIGERTLEGTVLGNTGNTHAKQHDFEAAIQFYEKALVMTRDLGNQYDEANALGNLGNAYTAQGDLGQALNYHQQALQLSRGIGNQIGEAKDLWNSSVVLYLQGYVEDAIKCGEEAARLFEITGEPGLDRVKQRISEWRQSKVTHSQSAEFTEATTDQQ